MKFTDFQFSEEVLDGIRDAGFVECTPVQDRVFAAALENRRDVSVRSQTGTGKTAAFLLTIFELMNRERDKGHKALIVAPTRELAVQIDEEAKLLGKHLPFNVASFYGGVGYGLQEKNLKEGVDIIIGTPGRLLDFGQSKKIDFSGVDMVVIDEADRLFDMGFFPDLKKMLRKMVKPEKRQTMLYSATLNMRVEMLAWEFMNHPQEIVIEPENLTVEEITQRLYHVAKEEKMKLLLKIFESEQPANALIFTNTKDMAVKVAKRLKLNGYQAEYIMGDLPQKKRLDIIERVKDGKLEILVATDVAARGLHIEDLEMVVNFDLPEDPENYVHRIGRTARAGKTGKAVSLACDKYVFGLESIEKLIGMKIPMEHPDDAFLDVEDKSEGVHVAGAYSRDSRGGSKNRSFSRGDSRSRPRGESRGGPSRKGAVRTPQKGPRKPEGSRTGGNSDDRQPAGANGPKGPKGGGKPAGKPTAKAGPPRGLKGPERKSDLDSRLEYYRQKYGEDFEVKTTGKPGKNEAAGRSTPPKDGGKKTGTSGPDSTKNAPTKKGLFGRLFSGKE
ncbi:MAG: DEAD/DEAH box helicase [Spirochaetia bacterium]